MATDREDLLDIKQAAQFLNVSETSLRRWTNDGRLVCFRVGRKRERRFRRDDLLSFLETQPGQGAPELQPRSVADRRDDLGSHRCGLYQSEQRGAAQAATFLGEGLLPGTVSYLVATPPARERVLAELESRALGPRRSCGVWRRTIRVLRDRFYHRPPWRGGGSASRRRHDVVSRTRHDSRRDRRLRSRVRSEVQARASDLLPVPLRRATLLEPQPSPCAAGPPGHLPLSSRAVAQLIPASARASATTARTIPPRISPAPTPWVSENLSPQYSHDVNVAKSGSKQSSSDARIELMKR